MLKNLFISKILIAVIGSCLCITATAENIKLTIASGQPPVFPYIQLLRDYFVPEIDRRLANTGHKIEWTQAYSGTVMKVGSEIESVKDGVVDVAFVLFTNNVSKLPLQSFTYFMPFSSVDASASVAAFSQTQKNNKKFNDVWERNGHEYLASVAIESFNLYSKKPVYKLSDLKGMKIGVIGPNANWLRNTGAVAVTLNLSQIANDLQNGIFDATLLGDSVAAAIKLNESGNYRTQFDVGSFVFAGLTINKQRWNAMPPEVRSVISSVANEYEKMVAIQLKQKAKEGVDGMIKLGMKNIEVSQSERVQWAELMPNLAQELINSSADKPMASDVMGSYIKGLKAHGQHPLRDWLAK